MLNTATFVPKGFTEGRHKMVSEALGQRIDRLGREVAPQRVLAVAAAAADSDDLERFFAQHMTWRAWRKAPGIYEITVLPDDLRELTSRPEMFRKLDLGGRLYGALVGDPNDTALVRLWVRDAEAAVREIGLARGQISGRGKGSLEATIRATALCGLLCCESIEGFEVLDN